MEMRIIVIYDTQDDFDMNQDIANFIHEKTSSH